MGQISRIYLFVAVQSLSCVWLLATPQAAARQASLSSAFSWSLLQFHVHGVGNAICLPTVYSRLQWQSGCNKDHTACKAENAYSLHVCTLSHFSHVQFWVALWTPPGSSVHGILQARILEWVAMPSSRGSSQPRGQICISYV